MSAGASHPHVAQLKALYREPDAPSLANTLVNIGAGLRAQCDALAANPTIGGCEQIASSLLGVHRHVLRLREKLMAEGQGGPHEPTA